MPYSYLKTSANLAAIQQRIEAAVYEPLAELQAKVWVTPEPAPLKNEKPRRGQRNCYRPDLGQVVVLRLV